MAATDIPSDTKSVPDGTNIESVRRLRDKTGCGMLDCSRALNVSKGDMEKAEERLEEFRKLRRLTSLVSYRVD